MLASDLPRPKLVATDLDGTLLRADKTVSSHTRRVVAGLEAAGIPVVAVTARQPYGLAPIAADVGLTGPAICANGAVCLDIADGHVWHSGAIPAAEAERLIRDVKAFDDAVLFATIGPVGEWFRAEEAYAEASVFSDHQRTRADMEVVGLDALAADCSKIVLRCPGEASPVTLDRIRHLVGECHATVSGAPFVEIMGPGVTKSDGLTRLCERLGITREDIWAFGDALNDVDMLTWAGRGFAVGNADEAVKAVADHVIASNENDGVARFLEPLLHEPTLR